MLNLKGCNPHLPVAVQWKPGTPGAVAKLEAFLGGKLHVFEHERVKVDRESTSQLSPWIHSGSISIRYIFYRVRPPCGCCLLPALLLQCVGRGHPLSYYCVVYSTKTQQSDFLHDRSSNTSCRARPPASTSRRAAPTSCGKWGTASTPGTWPSFSPSSTSARCCRTSGPAPTAWTTMPSRWVGWVVEDVLEAAGCLVGSWVRLRPPGHASGWS